MQVICPNCHRAGEFTENAVVLCPCGKDPKSRFTKQTLMIPLTELAKENA